MPGQIFVSLRCDASFNDTTFFSSGRVSGSRIPFLALPLVLAFSRWRVLTFALMAISITNHLLLTATDAQNPLAVGGHARNDRREDFSNNLVADYAWPLFAYGRAWPVLNDLLELSRQRGSTLAEEIEDPVNARDLPRSARIIGRYRRCEPSPFLLASFEGRFPLPRPVLKGCSPTPFILPFPQARGHLQSANSSGRKSLGLRHASCSGAAACLLCFRRAHSVRQPTIIIPRMSPL